MTQWRIWILNNFLRKLYFSWICWNFVCKRQGKIVRFSVVLNGKILGTADGRDTIAQPPHSWHDKGGPTYGAPWPRPTKPPPRPPVCYGSTVSARTTAAVTPQCNAAGLSGNTVRGRHLILQRRGVLSPEPSRHSLQSRGTVSCVRFRVIDIRLPRCRRRRYWRQRQQQNNLGRQWLRYVRYRLSLRVSVFWAKPPCRRYKGDYSKYTHIIVGRK